MWEDTSVGVVVAEDFVFWAKHIHGRIPLRGELSRLEVGTVITFGLDDVVGKRVEMNDRKRGASASGVMALGATGDHGHRLFQTGRSTVISISKVPEQVSDMMGASQ